jgi:hypothetical protein
MNSLTVLAPLLLAIPVTSLFILVPLYEYPTAMPVAWDNLISAIAAYSEVQFQVIINPDSGPGPNTNTYPNQDYMNVISKLNNHSNVITLGYVDTGYAQIPYSEVISNISTYAYWASNTKYNISIGGIFFDDVVGNYSYTNAELGYYRNISAYAYEEVPSTVTPVIFNPGSYGPEELFNYCDTMIEFEDLVSSYKNATTIHSLPSDRLDQPGIIIYNTSATTNIQSLVHTMAEDGVNAVYFDYGSCFYKGNPTGC